MEGTPSTMDNLSSYKQALRCPAACTFILFSRAEILLRSGIAMDLHISIMFFAPFPSNCGFGF